jgi:hypothetical protein
MMGCGAFNKPVLQYLEQPVKLRGLDDGPGNYINLAPVQFCDEVRATFLLDNSCKLLREPFEESDPFPIVELPPYSFLISRASEEMTS